MVLEKIEKYFCLFLAIFQYYLIFLSPEYKYSYSKHQLCFNKKIWEPVFGPQTNFFDLHFSERPSSDISPPQTIIRQMSILFRYLEINMILYGLISFYMSVIWFYLVFMWFDIVLYDIICFHMILHGLYGLYGLISFYIFFTKVPESIYPKFNVNKLASWRQ